MDVEHLMGLWDLPLAEALGEAPMGMFQHEVPKAWSAMSVEGKNINEATFGGYRRN